MSIAILLATYNGEKYIEEMLDSLINQNISDFRCYIHDDGSIDNTHMIIERYISKTINKKIDFYCMNAPRLGSAKANFMYMLSR